MTKYRTGDRHYFFTIEAALTHCSLVFHRTGIVLGVIGIVLSIVYLIFLVKNPNFITDFVNNLTTTTTTAGKLQGA